MALDVAVLRRMVTLNMIEEKLLKRTRHPWAGALMAKAHSMQISVVTDKLLNIALWTLYVARGAN